MKRFADAFGIGGEEDPYELKEALKGLSKDLPESAEPGAGEKKE